MCSKPNSASLNQPDFMFSHCHLTRFDSELNSELHVQSHKNKEGFESSVWIAYAQFSQNGVLANQTAQLVQQQKQAVRDLLGLLIERYANDFNDNLQLGHSIQENNDSHVNPVTDISSSDPIALNTPKLRLDESSFPYRLKPSNYYVSFSHSNNAVTCAISKAPVGIDIELSHVSMKVAKRFYHADEIYWLQTLPESDQQQALDLLWMLKESTIKRLNLSHEKANLMSGLKQNIITPVKLLLQQVSHHKSLSFFDNNVAHRSSVKASTASNLNGNMQTDYLINYLFLPSLKLVVAV